MSVFSRLKKRAAYAVGDTGLHVCELTFAQGTRVANIHQDKRTWLTLAFCIVDENGVREWPDTGNDEELATRVQAEAENYLTPGILSEIFEAMKRLSMPANQEALTKN